MFISQPNEKYGNYILLKRENLAVCQKSLGVFPGTTYTVQGHSWIKDKAVSNRIIDHLLQAYFVEVISFCASYLACYF